MPKKKQNKGINKGAIGAIAAGALAAIGTYVVYKTEAGKPVKRAIKHWVSDAKKEVRAELKKAKAVSKSTYDKAVKEVISRYKKGELGVKELKVLGSELASSWGEIEKDLMPAIKTVKKEIKKVSAKAKQSNKKGSNGKKA